MFSVNGSFTSYFYLYPLKQIKFIAIEILSNNILFGETSHNPP